LPREHRSVVHQVDHAQVGNPVERELDGGKQRIIFAALVTPANVMENQPMLDLLWRVRFRRKQMDSEPDVLKPVEPPRRTIGGGCSGCRIQIQTLSRITRPAPSGHLRQQGRCPRYRPRCSPLILLSFLIRRRACSGPMGLTAPRQVATVFPIKSYRVCGQHKRCAGHTSFRFLTETNDLKC